MPSYRNPLHRAIIPMPEETWGMALGFKGKGHALLPMMGMVRGPLGWYAVWNGWHLEDDAARDERLAWWADKGLGHALASGLVAPTPEEIRVFA